MKIRINEFKVDMASKDENLLKLISIKYKIRENQILDTIVLHKSVDARNKSQIILKYNLLLECDKNTANKILKYKNTQIYVDQTPKITYPKWDKPYRPVIIGFGPAGIFAALYLTRCDAKPIIIERGSKIEKRVNDVLDFLTNKKLNPSSNIQFGEGGAGTFSDGKLTTTANNPLISFILDEFVKFGAPKQIKYEANPHIGTDYLRIVVKNMREYMIANGAEFYFDTTFNDYSQKNDSIIVKTNKGLEFETKHLLLALGHSARDTFKMLHEKGIVMEPKSFSMGVRIEHRRETINKIQYGDFSLRLPAASYKIAVHLENRSVYSFCMCPGGEVMASQSEEGTIVTNGMSYFNRDKENSNAALLVNVDPKDYYVSSPLDGLAYQEKYEKLAYKVSNDYKAPANLVKEFLKGEVATQHRTVKPSYPHGVFFTSFDDILPTYVVESLREALPIIDKKMKGFMNDDAVLTGIESRSSSPVRIVRNDSKVSSNEYIYPIGEGAGYAGGITTSALDGLKTAIEIAK